VPKLAAAFLHAGTVFTEANKSSQSMQILDKPTVRKWEPTWRRLAATYLEPFFEDETLLVAFLIHPYNVAGQRHKVSTAIVTKAVASFKARLQTKLAELEAQRQAASSVPAAIVIGDDSQPPNGEGNKLAIDADLLSALGLDKSVLDSGRPAEIPQPRPLLPPLPSADDESKAYLLAVVSDGWSVHEDKPLALFKDGRFPIAKAVALDVLHVPAGEAPSERIFSVAGRVMRPDRSNLTPRNLAIMTYLRHNTPRLK